MTFEEWRHYEFGAQADEQGRFEISMLAAAWQSSRQQAIKECAEMVRDCPHADTVIIDDIAEAIERMET